MKNGTKRTRKLLFLVPGNRSTRGNSVCQKKKRKLFRGANIKDPINSGKKTKTNSDSNGITWKKTPWPSEKTSSKPRNQ